jgi:TPR repeat protein
MNSGRWADWDWHLHCKNRKGLASWLRVRARQGNRAAKAELAMMEFSKGKHDAPEAEALLAPVKEVALAGHLVAQEYLGRIYMDGTGVSADCRQAAYWLRLAGENPNHRSHVHYFGNNCVDPRSRLGLLYREGKGVERDFIEGARWIKQCSELGGISGSFVMGMAYECGYGVEQDGKLARRRYEDSIEEDGWAITALAEFFLERLMPSCATPVCKAGNGHADHEVDRECNGSV